jgi:tetratricopeptide (TPR) repeat protein
MALVDIAISIESFRQVDWGKIIEQCDRKDCAVYSHHFFDAAKAAENQPEVIQDIYELLGHITSPMLRSDSDNEPFHPRVVLPDGLRSAVPKDFSDQQLNLLLEMAPNLQDPELRARIADILWETKRDFKMAQIAVASYLESAQNLEDPEQWTFPFQRVQRAVRIAIRLGKNNAFFDNVISYVESLLAKYKAEDPLYFSAKLMRLLQEQRLGDFEKYAELSEKAAISAEQSGEWDRSREYWDVTGRWYSLSKNVDEQKRIQIKIAETYISESNTAISNSPSSYMIAASSIQKAIEAYRRVGGMRERIEELHKLLLEYQSLAMSEMKTFSHEIDTTDLVLQSKSQVHGKSFKDAIIRLVLMGCSPSVENLRLQVKEALRNHPMQFLLGETLYNEAGKVVAQRPSIISDDPEESEAALQISMLKYAGHHRHVYAGAVIDPARHQINLEHNARGLLEGLRGDFMISTHLLIPQIEHSIRYLMIQKGCIVSGLDDRGVQDEHNINALIRRPELVEILGEDIVFNLKGILVHRFGSNIRNRMAHGLMGHSSFFDSDNVYLWWFTLHLFCLPIIKLNEQSEG